MNKGLELSDNCAKIEISGGQRGVLEDLIYFDDLPLENDILKALEELKIEYVFQPIFHPNGEIFAHEALMRPMGCTVIELIDEYTKNDNLHVLEVATFFGAMQAYHLRGYVEPICINSFPSEHFTDEEAATFDAYFGDNAGRGIIEILEYPDVSLESWVAKKEALEQKNLRVSLDDFGVGQNDMNAVNLFAPHIVKLDRSLISDIDKDSEKQLKCKEYIEDFHKRNITVLAEGVETKEEYDFLVENGIDLLQGYYLARPA